MMMMPYHQNLIARLQDDGKDKRQVEREARVVLAELLGEAAATIAYMAGQIDALETKLSKAQDDIEDLRDQQTR